MTAHDTLVFGDDEDRFEARVRVEQRDGQYTSLPRVRVVVELPDQAVTIQLLLDEDEARELAGRLIDGADAARLRCN